MLEFFAEVQPILCKGTANSSHLKVKGFQKEFLCNVSFAYKTSFGYRLVKVNFRNYRNFVEYFVQNVSFQTISATPFLL